MSEGTFTFFITKEKKDKLRKIAFEKRIAIAQLIREGIDLILEKYEK